MADQKTSNTASAIDTARHLSGASDLGATASESTIRTIRKTSDLGEYVALRRKAKNYTQQEFADLAGVGRRFLSELESGKPTAQIGKVLQVLSALGTDLKVEAR
jgi:HTH-type transcriptional regulator/antitoxin HipB